MNRKNIILIAVLGAAALLIPLFSGPYQMSVLRTVLTYAALAVSWDMLIRSGQLSFGIAGFFGLGTYISAIFSIYLNMPGIPSIIIGGVLTCIIAMAIGTIILRLRGMYFAITTMALGEIFRIIIRNGGDFTGGPEGLIMSKLVFNGGTTATYYLALAVALIAIGASVYFQKSRFHLALTTIRNNERVAMTSGINIYKTLIIVFGITAGIQALAGAGYAQMYGFVTPESSFSSDYTLLPLAMSLLGGMYGTWGPVVGAFLLGILSEYLKLYIPYGHLIIYGIIIVFVIIVMPQGILGLLKKKFRKEAA